MNSKQSLIVAVFCVLLAVTAGDNGLVQHNSDMGLLNFMARSNDALQRNPERSLECFNYYIPLINEIAVLYETNFKGCLDASAIGHSNAEEATLEKRNELANKAETSCALMKKCGESDSAEDVFTCFIQGGSENSKTMYGINADASEDLAELLEQFRLVENQENRCTTETKRSYEASSTEAYDDLNNCILGISEVPTEAPSTEAPSTDAPATDAPSTDAPSTDAPSTDVPSTDAPSTDAPSTDAPSTDAPSTDAPSTDAPSTDAPSTDAPSTDAPSTDAPSTDAPSTDAPSTDAPSTDAPATDAPSTDAPSTDAPSTDAPSTDAPSTDAPSTDVPSTDAPATDAPATNAPSTAAPATEKPSTEEDSNEDSDGDTDEESTEESGGDTEEDRLPEEDISRFLALKNLKYRLEKFHV